VIKDKELYAANNEIHSIHTRQHLNFHQPSADLTKYQTGVYCNGFKIFNTLPPCIKQESDNPKEFESLLKNFCMKINFILWKNFTDCLNFNNDSLISYSVMYFII